MSFDPRIGDCPRMGDEGVLLESSPVMVRPVMMEYELYAGVMRVMTNCDDAIDVKGFLRCHI
jgi:hypothetical protein